MGSSGLLSEVFTITHDLTTTTLGSAHFWLPTSTVVLCESD